MKPSGPLSRNVPLATTSPMARGAGLARGGPLERHTRLRPRSRKTARIYVTRREIVAELFLYPTLCEVPECPNLATDPHEPLTRARGGDILDPANIRLVCHFHNCLFASKEEPWMYSLGFLVHSWPDDGASLIHPRYCLSAHIRRTTHDRNHHRPGDDARTHPARRPARPEHPCPRRATGPGPGRVDPRARHPAGPRRDPRP